MTSIRIDYRTTCERRPRGGRRRRDDLEAKLLEGIDSGHATEMTADDWADIRRQVADRAADQGTARKPRRRPRQ